CSDEPGERLDRPPWSSQRRHARASLSRRVRRTRGKRSIDGGPRTGRAGSPCPWPRRTRNPSPRPATAFADARPLARHEHGSRPSPSLRVARVQPPIPAVTRLLDPFLLLLCSYFCSFALSCFLCLKKFLTRTAVTPPPEAVPATMTAVLAKQIGHMVLLRSFPRCGFGRRLQIIGQPIERALPEFPILFDPLRGLFERFGVELH